MAEPEEFNLFLNLFAGIAILSVFAAGGSLYFLFGRPTISNRFPVLIPIKGAILSLLGVFAIALVIGGLSFVFRILFR